MDYSQYITVDPNVCGGAPVIRGTRVTVRTILASLAEGATADEIHRDFPSLPPDAIAAAVAYAVAIAGDEPPPQDAA
jgi:uncharacterized protein (DUF433 family)